MMRPQLNYDKQTDLLARRDSTIDDHKERVDFLPIVSYYRSSGYFRYWQHNPAKGDNRLHRGSSFEIIRDPYAAEQHLKALYERMSRLVEVLLRTRFAHSYAERFGAYKAFNADEGFTRPLEEEGRWVEEYALRDLDRSKEAFVAHCWENFTIGDPTAHGLYDQMLIWTAVEAFSFGILLRLIETPRRSEVLDAVVDGMKISHTVLASQVRSLVHLRDRIAYHARLWNHSVLDASKIAPSISRRAKKAYRSFDDRSIYETLVALDSVCANSKLRANWFEEETEPFSSEHSLLAMGVTTS